ncbi:MAG TPA: Na+/H+ antiporter [Usitatibacteraceae bacterium]|nr:Na+/H+ antiporter [Usitatibacteraceae bacterium]
MQVIDLAPVIVLTAIGGVLGRWSRMPLPIFLVVVGAVASFIPGLDAVKVDPEVFLLLFIPPLLFADARVLPRRDLLHVLRPVLLLALGLVVLTVIAVGYFIHWLIPSMPLAVAFTLGAIVSPTDAVATVATTATVPLPNRVTHIVNAESLLNDATGLVAFKLAVVTAVAASYVSMYEITGQFVILSGGGLFVGIVIEWIGRKLREQLIILKAEDPVVQTLLTVLVPYAAYIVAEALHVSGILAVVASGLWAGGQEVKGLSVESRRHAREVWRMIGWVFNGLVFVLLGLQLRQMVQGVANHDVVHLAYWAMALWVLLMLLRFGWVWASAHVRFRLHWGWAGGQEGPDPKRMFLVGWAAVRGSITLATALSIPLLTGAGDPFPERDLVVFLAAATIILTLALNGLSLPWFIRRLRAQDDDRGEIEESAARTELARAAIAVVEPAAERFPDPEDKAFARALLGRYQGKVDLRESSPEQAESRATHIATARRLRLDAIAAERERLHELLKSDAINDATALLIEEELDEHEVVSSADPDRG